MDRDANSKIAAPRRTGFRCHADGRRRRAVTSVDAAAFTACMVLVLLAADLLARLWSWFHGKPFQGLIVILITKATGGLEAIQLLQGDIIKTNATSKAPTGCLAVLLGSILLAIVVSSSSTHTTASQRKMEQVFSVMGKLRLPHPIRERVHQYYEYLDSEFDSLDGEVAKFTRDLSHTLEQEVVLFKYMDVLMQVPHWRGCSPDFQKQLVLNLKVRIYLPDDFVMRRGEVGTECYLINRGTCKLYVFPTGNHDSPTPALAVDNESHSGSAHEMSSTSDLSVVWSMRPLDGDVAIKADADGLKNGLYKSVSVMERGQAIGEFALLANYERSADVRAVTYVEICVIERTAFQQLLTRYSSDRQSVVASMVRDHVHNLAAQGLPCPYTSMVKQVDPDASIEQVIEYVSSAMSHPQDDPSILFGMSTQFLGRLEQGLATTLSDDGADEAGNSDPSPTPPLDPDLEATLRELQARLRRLEERRGQPPRVRVPVRRRRRDTTSLTASSWSRATKRR